MKRTLVFAWIAVLLAGAAPASAQIGGILGKAQKAKETADKAKDAFVGMSDKDEQTLGEQVSSKLRGTFGVHQDPGVTKYVALVGTVLAQASTRPNLNWKFIVLDTDAVNAYAAPGGFVHITKGLLGLVKNEAELADVLGHEITHVTQKHTLKSIQNSKRVSFVAEQGPSAGGGLAADIIARLAEVAYSDLLQNKFDRNDEMESDRVGIQLANKVGYSASALSDVLKRLEDRNKGATTSNGLFASHPDTQARLDGIAKTIKDQKLTATATVPARYKGHITWDAKPVSEIATADVLGGTKALTGGSSAKSDDKSKEAEKKDDSSTEQPKKKGGLLGKINLSGGSQAQSSQTTASAGGRALGKDNEGKGGPNHNLVPVTLTPAEIDAFKKGITG
jgi:predicted Zn-dependent protease